MRPAPPVAKPPALRRWMVVCFGAWVLLAGAYFLASNYIDRLALCERTSVTAPGGDTREVTTTDVKQGTGTGTEIPADTIVIKESTAPPTATETTKCAGIGTGQLVVLLLPGLLFLLPALKDIDIAGLFKLTFKDVEAKLDEQGEKVDEVAAEVRDIRLTQQTMLAVRQSTNVFVGVSEEIENSLRDAELGRTTRLEDLPGIAAFIDSSAEQDPPNAGGEVGGSQ